MKDVKDIPETPLTYSDVLELLQIEEVPGEQHNKDFAVEAMNASAKRYGLEWIRQNRVRLIKELEYLPTLM